MRVSGGFLSVSLAGLSVDRPCARAIKVDCPYPLSQVTARNSVVWALTEQRALLYREGVSSFCPEGEQWKCDIVRYQRGRAETSAASRLSHLRSSSAVLPFPGQSWLPEGFHGDSVFCSCQSQFEQPDLGDPPCLPLTGRLDAGSALSFLNAAASCVALSIMWSRLSPDRHYSELPSTG